MEVLCRTDFCVTGTMTVETGPTRETALMHVLTVEMNVLCQTDFCVTDSMTVGTGLTRGTALTYVLTVEMDVLCRTDFCVMEAMTVGTGQTRGTALIVRFDCGNGRSLPNGFMCDGGDDCGNWADERNCSHVRFDCGNGRSVPNGFLCDGGDDCGNGADERNCSHVLFDCENGRSVRRRYLCDGGNDCGNGADERNCTNEDDSLRRPTGRPCIPSQDRQLGIPDTAMEEIHRRIPSHRLYCGNGITVSKGYLCDGEDDCGNGADEKDCSHDVPVEIHPVVTPVFLKDAASIHSPNFPGNYPHNSNVLWNISTAPGHRIQSVFQEYHLEYSVECTSDRVSFYDGHELSSLSLGVFCDYYRLSETVLSSSNAMLVQFTSDSTISWEGFRLALTTVCGGHLFAQPSENEILSHPKFGKQAYGENLICEWIIKVRPERNVQITFSDFDVGPVFQISKTDALPGKTEANGCENSDTTNCVQYNAPKENISTDFVEVYDGPADSRKIIGKYSGDQTPPVIISREEELLIRFRSGFRFGKFRGFRVIYQEV